MIFILKNIYIKMNKEKIRLTESQLNYLVQESIKNVLMENDIDEAWWDKLAFGTKKAKDGVVDGTKNVGKAIGKGVENVGKAINKGVEKVGKAYNDFSDSMEAKKQKMNDYSKLKDNERAAGKNMKSVDRLIADIQKFLDLDILNNVSFGKKAQQQAATFMKTLNALKNSGFKAQQTTHRTKANAMMGESLDSKIDRILAETIEQYTK